ncbi:TIGR03984 family CRISPR-associated protein [Phormidium pseudopriestleyi FRX01]|uniref:TIGR03984 family CRISPR-associated protein n=1 Tax=Phormidium pseudopriestleyi FRX01 TaxID=1759528 RepID=A0ABS3FN39_9CYAN|nr:CRISPR-associated protein Csx19 [Phormidium pseudopriestleyi]MBO0348511.1 TIGR03984 family CRISPR-associated protein [Phormidium pseudopriestleyi FRX01]
MTSERLKRHHRQIIKRLIVRGILVLDTPTCLGNGNSDSKNPTDLMLLRDSISDRALLTGASIAGALRNYLHEYEKGYGKDEEENSLATALFGGIRSQEDGDQSPLIVDDALSISVEPTIELRDGVRIDSKTGTAADKAKYDLELLAAGTQFPLCFELVIDKTDDEAKLIKALGLALQGLEKGEIGLGMKKRRGFGRCHVKAWESWLFDLRISEERLAWLMFDYQSTIDATHASISEALDVKLEDEDKRDRFVLKATFKLASPLLIRSSPGSSEYAPDVVHLRSHRQGKPVPVLSGTSLAGVLWHRTERIIETLGKSRTMLAQLFGVVDEKTKEAQASRLIVHESVIENTAELVQNRIAIDRFTGGAYHGALFDEQILCGSNETRINLELELRQPSQAEVGLLLLLLKDLWTSDLPVGGEKSIGRGKLQGIKAEMEWHHRGPTQQTWTITQDGKGKLKVSDKNLLEDCVKSLKAETVCMSKQLCTKIGIDDIVDDETFTAWLEKQAQQWQLDYLLAHAEDGVIWGYFKDSKLTTANHVFPQFPALRLFTLQQCRIFGYPGEVLVWRTGSGLQARLVQDNNGTERLPDEKQILWGTQGKEKNGFTLLSDGQEGLKHAVPLTGIDFESQSEKMHRPVRLVVRHYIDYDNKSGVARIFLSRLVSLTSEKGVTK